MMVVSISRQDVVLGVVILFVFVILLHWRWSTSQEEAVGSASLQVSVMRLTKRINMIVQSLMSCSAVDTANIDR